MAITLVRYWGREARSQKEIDYFVRLLKQGNRLGWNSHVVFARPPEDETWLSPLKKLGVQIEYIPRPKKNFDWNIMFRTYQFCKRVNANIIHCDNTHTSPLIGAFFARVPVRLWSKRSMEPSYEEMREPTWRERWAPSLHISCRLVTKTLAVSEAVRDELIARRIPASKMYVLHDFSDLKTIQLSDRSFVRSSLGYDESHVVISTIGRAAPVKGWDSLLSAFTKVCKTLPQARLVFIGGIARDDEREGYAALQQFIDQHRLHGLVHFAGHLENVGELLSATDVFVSPSRSEGFGIALQEAFALGYACVATKVGIAPTMITHGTNGLLVERDNPEEMAQALINLVQDSSLRQRFALAARERRFGYSIDEYRERLYDLYQLLLNEPQVINSEHNDAQRNVA